MPKGAAPSKPKDTGLAIPGTESADAPGKALTSGEGQGTDTVSGFDASGAPLSVPVGQAKKAFGAGKLFFSSDQSIPVVSPDGKVGSVPASQIDHAFSAGYTPTSRGELDAATLQEKHGGLGGMAAAVAEGGARGLTLGLSDPLAIGAARAIGGEKAAAATREHLAGTKAANPITSTGSEIAGAIAPVLLSGGAGAAVEGAEAARGAAALGEAAQGATQAARAVGAVEGTTSALGSAVRAAGVIPRGVAAVGNAVARGTEAVVGTGAKGLLGRVAQKAIPMAAQGAAEGAVYGAGNEVSESALGNTDLTGEKLVSAALSGAKWGAAGGGILGAAEVGAKAVGEKAMRIVGEGGLHDFVQSFADNRLGKAFGMSTKRDVVNLSRQSLTEEIGAKTAVETERGIESRLKEVANTARNYHLEDGEKLFNGNESVETLAKKSQKAIDEQAAKLNGVRAQVRDVAVGDLGPDVHSILGKVDKELINPLRKSDFGPTRALADRVDAAVKDLREATTGETAALKGPVTLQRLEGFRNDLSEFIFPKKLDGIPPPPPEAKQQLMQLRAIVENEIEKTTERAAQASGNPQLMSEYLDAKRKLHDLIPLNKMAETYTANATARRIVSPSDQGWGAVGSMGALATGHAALPAMALGGAMTLAHKFIRERGAAFASAAAQHLADRISTISAVGRAAAEVDSKIESGVAAFLRPTANSKATASVAYVADDLSRQKSYTKAREAVVEAAANPDRHLAKVARHLEPIAQHAPLSATAAAATITRGQQFLQSKLPEPPIKPAQLQPHLADKALPSNADMAKFMRYSKAVQHPLSVLDDMKAGRVSLDSVEAVKAVYPELYQQMQTQAMKQVADSKKKLPYEKRIQLGVMFGIPTDPMLDPATVHSIQGVYAAPEAKQGGAGPAGSEKLGGPAHQLKGANRQLTPSQTLSLDN